MFRACPAHRSSEQVQSGAERSVHQYGQLQSCVNFEEVRFVCDDVYTSPAATESNGSVTCYL
jgi:hypothetical protein